MILQGNEDLRIKKTITAIKRVFEEMVQDMGYEKITVKQLCERADINKKTFYRYYDTLDNLLIEIQEELSYSFFERVSRFSFPEELDKINEEFFLFASEQRPAYEKIICEKAYKEVRDQLSAKIADTDWCPSKYYQQLNDFEKSIFVGFISNTCLAAYRQWVKEGKRIPIEEVVEMTNRILIGGAKGFFKVNF